MFKVNKVALSQSVSIYRYMLNEKCKVVTWETMKQGEYF